VCTWVQFHIVVCANPLHFLLCNPFLLFRGKLGLLYATDPLSNLHRSVALIGSSVELLYKTVSLLTLSSTDQHLAWVHNDEHHHTS